MNTFRQALGLFLTEDRRVHFMKAFLRSLGWIVGVSILGNPAALQLFDLEETGAKKLISRAKEISSKACELECIRSARSADLQLPWIPLGE